MITPILQHTNRNTIQTMAFAFACCAMFLALCASAEAQQPVKSGRLGLLSFAAPPPPSTPTPFDEILRQLGYVEGQNITIERRYVSGQLDRLPELARDLARLSPDVILAQTYPAAAAAKQATSTIPIVVVGAGDPVAPRLVASFARPGGNITGVSALETELSGKRIELLKEAFSQVGQRGGAVERRGSGHDS